MNKVEVIYARDKDSQEIISLEIAENTTALRTIELSGILNLYPEIDLSKNAIGVFGQEISLNTLVCGGDRIEIYRPLATSAIEKRRARLKHL